ncbi:MAG: alpha/beta fold hydrolase [Crocinitomicaceae bacterium]
MLHYRTFGEGKTLVFLHGFLESSTMWDYLPLEELNAHCLLIDLPGHGQSPLNDLAEIPSIRYMADEVFRVLKAENVAAFTLIGHSLGGYVGLELAQMPGCQKLILLNSNCWSDDEQKRRDRLRVAELVFKAKHHFIREAIPNLFGRPNDFQKEITALMKEAKLMEPEAIAYAALAMRERMDYTQEVVANPSMYVFIHGEMDTLVSTETLQKRLPGITIHLITNAGHMSHLESSNHVMDILMEEKE